MNVQTIPSVQAAADSLLTRHPLLSQGYFAHLQAGKMERASFVNSQRQFYHAVTFFSRAMAALMARLPNSASRQVLMHNLAEEHGWDDEGQQGFRASMAHDCTFRAFLERLGVEPAPEGPEVRAFNLALYGACTCESTALAFACLGMIEYAFADISALIGEAVAANGWIEPAEMVHYTVHAAIDKGHAAQFFGSIEGACRHEVESGLELGWYIFRQLYQNLSYL